MPELKVPPFLIDLYYDLRDRRLLPLVALVVVAIVAVPFLLGGGSEEAGDAAARGRRPLHGPRRQLRLGRADRGQGEARPARLPQAPRAQDRRPTRSSSATRART